MKCNRSQISAFKGQCNYQSLCRKNLEKKRGNYPGELYKYENIPTQNKDNIKRYFSIQIGRHCPVCGESRQPDKLLTLDHIFPQKPESGYEEDEQFIQSCIENFKYLCQECNGKKGNYEISDLEYQIIKEYNIVDDYETFICSDGIHFPQKLLPISLYYSIQDEYNFLLEYELLTLLNEVGYKSAQNIFLHKYIKNTLERKKNDI